MGLDKLDLLFGCSAGSGSIFLRASQYVLPMANLSILLILLRHAPDTLQSCAEW
jgi:hypothetical protein